MSELEIKFKEDECGHPILETIGKQYVTMLELQKERDEARAIASNLWAEKADGNHMEMRIAEAMLRQWCWLGEEVTGEAGLDVDRRYGLILKDVD